MPTGMAHTPEEDKPREKLYRKGAQELTDSELLAILLRTGSRGESVIDLSKRIISESRNISVLARKSVAELTKFKGIGKTKAVTLFAAFELAKRITANELTLEKTRVTSPDIVAEYFARLLVVENTEGFYVVCLNTQNQIIAHRKLTSGILDASAIHQREVFRYALENNAKSIILLHNHPSGNTDPSPQDIEVTRSMVNAGKLMGIAVLDHIITAGGKFTSIISSGYITP